MDKIDSDTMSAGSNLKKMHNKDLDFALKNAECEQMMEKREERRRYL
jgi:hypothetical protein